MIKPEAVKEGDTGAILDRIIKAGFKITALKLTRLTGEGAKKFYEVHSEKPFYRSLVAYMASGPIIAAILEKENAVDGFRTLIGATNPADAAEGTIRKRFGKSLESNAVHGSDCDETARVESDFNFTGSERF